eukprot:s528_g4.t1
MAGYKSASYDKVPDDWSRPTTWPPRKTVLERGPEAPHVVLSTKFQEPWLTISIGIKEILEELGCTVYNPNTDNKARSGATNNGLKAEVYKEEADSRWLLTFQEHLDIIEKSKRGFVLQIQQGQVREKSYMQISEEKMGKKWYVPRIGLYAFPITHLRGGGSLAEEFLATAVEKARAQWEEGVKDEVQMVSEWFEPIGGDLEMVVNGEGKVQGRARCTWPSGQVYEGDWKDGSMHGKGTYKYADGAVYVGEFKDGKRNGKGTYTYVDGAVYVGEYKNDKMHGTGTYTYKSGDVEVGFYEQGKDKGRGVQLSANGKKAWLLMDGKKEREVSVAEARKTNLRGALLASHAAVASQSLASRLQGMYFVSNCRYTLWNCFFVCFLLCEKLPERASLYANSKDVEADATASEKWYGTRYGFAPVSDSTLQRWEIPDTVPGYAVPPPNPYIPRDFSPRNPQVPLAERAEAAAEPPRVLQDDERWQIFYKGDRCFGVPKAVVLIFLGMSDDTVDEDAVPSRLWLLALTDYLSEMFYDASYAGFQFQVSNEIDGLSIQFAGFSDKLVLLVEKVLSTLQEFQGPSDQDFAEVLDRVRREQTKSFDAQPSYQYAAYSARIATHNPDYSIEFLRRQTAKASAAAARNFGGRLRRRSPLYGQALLQGNVGPADAAEIQRVLNAMPFEPLPRARRTRVSVVKPPRKGALLARSNPNPSETNRAIWVTFSTGPEAKVVVMTELLQQILADPFYNEIRTKQQLGYVVLAQADRDGLSARLSLAVQSSSREPEELLEAVQAFLVQFKRTLAELPAKEFSAFKIALVEQIVKPDERLGPDCTRPLYCTFAMGVCPSRHRRSVDIDVVVSFIELGDLPGLMKFTPSNFHWSNGSLPPLHFAILQGMSRGKHEIHLGIVEWMLNAGADPHHQAPSFRIPGFFPNSNKSAMVKLSVGPLATIEVDYAGHSAISLSVAWLKALHRRQRGNAVSSHSTQNHIQYFESILAVIARAMDAKRMQVSVDQGVINRWEVMRDMTETHNVTFETAGGADILYMSATRSHPDYEAVLAALSLAHRWEVANTVHILSDLLRDLGAQTKTS